jgi:hypothetical protein
VLEKIVAQIAVAMLAWLDSRLSRSSTAVDADLDPERLRRAGARIAQWMQQQDRVRSGGVADEGRTPQ